MPEIQINSIQLNGKSFPVPHGLSDLLTDKCWSKEKRCNVGYKREVIQKDDRVFTILTKEATK